MCRSIWTLTARDDARDCISRRIAIARKRAALFLLFARSRASFVYPIRELDVNVLAWTVKDGISRARFDREAAVKVHRTLHEIIVIR